MTAPRIALGVIAALFVVSEVLRPTRVPAKKSAHGLIVNAQAVAGTVAHASLDPNLLDDLPRIHPDAMGDVMCARERDGSFRVVGRFYADDDGSAVFVESDGTRLGAEATIFGEATRPRFDIVIPMKDLGSGKHRLRIALISRDERGYFLMTRTIALTIGASSHASDGCRVARAMLTTERTPPPRAR